MPTKATANIINGHFHDLEPFLTSKPICSLSASSTAFNLLFNSSLTFCSKITFNLFSNSIIRFSDVSLCF